MLNHVHIHVQRLCVFVQETCASIFKGNARNKSTLGELQAEDTSINKSPEVLGTITACPLARVSWLIVGPFQLPLILNVIDVKYSSPVEELSAGC